MTTIKHTYTLSVKNNSGSSVVASTTAYEADAESNFQQLAPAGENVEIALPVDVSAIESFYIYSDQDVKLNTNDVDDVDADQTFNLKAKVPLYWNSDRPETNPLTADITSLFFINDGETDANVKGGFLLNA